MIDLLATRLDLESYRDRQRRILDALRSGVRQESHPRSTGSLSRVSVLHCENGDVIVRKVANVIDCDSEEISALVAYVIDPTRRQLVAPAVVRTGDREVCSEYVNDAGVGGYCCSSCMISKIADGPARRSAALIACLDWIITNVDRHRDNVILTTVGDTQVLAPIDHGYVFGGKGGLRSVDDRLDFQRYRHDVPVEEMRRWLLHVNQLREVIFYLSRCPDSEKAFSMITAQLTALIEETQRGLDGSATA